MRTIKFRAWHKEIKQMAEVTNVKLPNETENKWIVIMQYTGLKDKNGKEIYESDLLLKDGAGGTFEVVWNKDRWGMQDRGGEYDIKGSLEIVGNIYEN